MVPRLPPRQPAMRPDRFHQLLSHRHERVERRHRILEDGADPRASENANLGLGQPIDALPGEADLATANPSSAGEKPEHGGAGQRLAGSRLADQTKDLSRGNVERHAAKRLQRGTIGTRRYEFHLEVTDLQHRLRHARAPYPSLGFVASRSQSPRRLVANTMATSVKPGNTATHQEPEKR